MAYYTNQHSETKRESKSIKGPVLLTIILGLLLTGGIWFLHIPLNPNSLGFWLELVVVLIVVTFCVSTFVDAHSGGYIGDTMGTLLHGGYDRKSGKDKKPLLACVLAFIAVAVLIGMAIGSPLISSSAYARRMEVEESSFDEWSDDLRVEGISLMDTASATKVGNRELGSLQDVVSQFDDATYYQVILNGTPQKVAPLQYVSFFTWLNNRETGAPGYVLVDPIKQNADYHKLASIEGTGDGLRYIPSACLIDNLQRLVWSQYPTKVLGTPHFELDDEGHPFYVTQSFGYASFMGARYVEGVIVTDPTDGTSEYYDAKEVPTWLDVVYDGDLLDEMYDDYGKYSGGFWNSVFGQVGCTRTGGDYGYVMIGDEQWIYTGITSMGGDSSNIGFLLASEKTGKAYFLPMASADEESAMTSAEGKVQQYGYKASFPSLVSIDGQPTYVMVLKDGGGLIRLYAMVNAESYNVVACEPDLVSCKASYEKAMKAAGIEFDDDEQTMPAVDATGAEGTVTADGTDAKATGDATEFEMTVASTQLADEDGNTYLYLLSEDGDIYRIAFADDPKLCMTVKKGDEVTGTATEAGDVYEIASVGK